MRTCSTVHIEAIDSAGERPAQKGFIMQMTPKRLRLIASVIRRTGLVGGLPSTNEALAHELEEHATELEESQTIRLKEPGTVFGDLKAQAEKSR